MKIIMNPPYEGNLHLKILNKMIEEFPEAEIVNLSPIRWLQDPLAEYKKASDFKRFPKIRERIESLEEHDVKDMGAMFGAWMSSDLGIYHITQKGGWQPKDNKLLEKVLANMKDNVKNHIVNDEMDGICIYISLISADPDGGVAKTQAKGFNLPKEKAYFTNRICDATGETYYEYRKRVITGLCKLKAWNSNVKFATREERDNFYDSWNTKTLRWLFATTKQTSRTHVQFLPWLGDYTKKWDDAALREYFSITDEEWQEIERTVPTN